MIYAIAAYSITLGVLALYWVFVQHKAKQSAEDVAQRRGAAIADSASGFNVGASLLGPVWLLRHGMALPGALLLVPCIAVIPLYEREMWTPLLFVGMIPVAAGAALGLVGNRIAVQHTGVERPGALSETQLPWAVAGVILHLFLLPWAWYFIAGTN